MALRDEIDIRTELELAQARELRETAIRADKPDENAVDKAEARFRKASEDRIKYLEKELAEANAAKKAPEELVKLFDMSEYLRAASTKTPIQGAMAELNKELNMDIDPTQLGTVFPIELAMKNFEAEMNADANTVVSNVTNAQPLNQGPITPLIYARNAREFLGVDMPVVAPGKQSYPYMTGGATVSMVAEAGEVDSVAATFGKVEITPTRASGAFTVSVDSLLDVGPELQNILENDLMMALSDLLDTQLIAGNGTAPNLKGIMSQLPAAVAADGDTGNSADDDEFTWTDYAAVDSAALDDKIFRTEGELRLLIGTKTYQHAKRKWNSATVPSMNGLEIMRRDNMGVRYSGRLAAPAAATGAKGSLQEAILVADQHARNTIMPVWQQGTLLVDPYSQGRAGILEVSVAMYVGLGYRRSGSNAIEGWKKVFFTLTDHT